MMIPLKAGNKVILMFEYFYLILFLFCVLIKLEIYRISIMLIKSKTVHQKYSAKHSFESSSDSSSSSAEQQIIKLGHVK